MDLLQNPFYILTATQRDNRHRIMEFAEERSLLSDVDKCIAARATLINPRKRISAEMAWLPGVASKDAYDILMLLEASAGNHLVSDKRTSIVSTGLLSTSLSHLPNARTYNVADKILDSLISPNGNFTEISEFLGINALTPIARANLLAARMVRLPDYTSDFAVKWILAITETFENINPLEVREILNAERKDAGFPEITELSDITTEIQNCRRYYQQVIKFVLESIPSPKERVKAVMIVVESAIDSGESRWPILIEDTLDSYEVGAQAFLESKENNIKTLNQKLRIAAEEEIADTDFDLMVDELTQVVKDWNTIAYPIQLNKNRQGLRHDASHDVSDRVQQLAIHLFNEYDKLGFSRKILIVLKEVFGEIPAIAERVTANLETLNKIIKRREQQKF